MLQPLTGRPRGRPPKDRDSSTVGGTPLNGRSGQTSTSRYANSTPSRNPSLLPTRSSRSQPLPPSTQSQPPIPQQKIYYHPSLPPGPTPYFLPPPCQPTLHPPNPNHPPTTQAFHSTYPSRLRTGVTNLIQPEQITGGPRDRDYLLAELDRELATAGGSGASTPIPGGAGGGRRGGGRVSYVDKGSGDEEEEEEDEEDEDEEVGEGGSDPEDGDFGVRGGGKRRRIRGTATVGALGNVEAQAMVRAGKLRKKKDDLDKGMTWLGERPPGDRVKSVRVKGTKHQYISEELLEREKDRVEWLVPITVDFDVAATYDHPAIKIKDRFLWNLNEPFLKPYQFASIFCEDLAIPLDPYARVLSDLIQAQLDEAAGQGVLEVDILDEEVGEDDVIWSEEEEGEADVKEVEEGEGEEDEEVIKEEKVWKEADCRVVLNLDVQISTHILRDRIEWDLSSPLPPSQFAASYIRDLGLTGEAHPLITHALIDEITKHKRDALDLELFPGRQDRWERAGGGRVNNRKGAKGLVGVWRDWGEVGEFGPVLVELTVEQMERREQERNREARRMMRTLNTKRRR